MSAVQTTRRRVRLSRIVVAVVALALGACGGSDEPASTPDPVVETFAPPATESGDLSDAGAYARVVMSTNMSEVFSGYEVDGDTVRFTVAEGVTLSDDECQYLKLSNSALRQAAGISVVVDDHGTDRPC